MQLIDYSARPPSPAAIRQRGYGGVLRYLAPLPNPKCLTRAEAELLTAAGLLIGLVWEAGSNGTLSGAAGGTEVGKAAAAQAKALGAPAGAVVYIANDFGATASQLPTVAAHLDAARRVLHGEGFRQGVYGSFDVVATMLRDGHAEKGWQTSAWSGKWPPGHPNAGQARVLQGTPNVVLYQRLEQVVIDGTPCDVNDVWGDDWGGWNLAKHPTPAPPAPTPAPPTKGPRMHAQATITIDASNHRGSGVAVVAGTQIPVNYDSVVGMELIANGDGTVPNCRLAKQRGLGNMLVIQAAGDPGTVGVDVAFDA